MERLTAKDIYNNYYDCLTQLERDIYTTSDNSINDFYFGSVEDYKEFCKGFITAMEYFRSAEDE